MQRLGAFRQYQSKKALRRVRSPALHGDLLCSNPFRFFRVRAFMQSDSTTSRWFDQFLLAPLRRVTDDQNRFLQSPQAKQIDLRVIVVYLSVGVILSCQYYLFGPGKLQWVLDTLAAVWPNAMEPLRDWLLSPQNQRLSNVCYWATGQTLLYAVAPMLIIKLVFRERLSDYGLKFRGVFDGWWVYLVMFSVMLPIVLYVSASAAFQRQYPFYHPGDAEPLWPRFWIWQLFYAAQFVALEFFFRGFMLHGVKHRLGAYAIFVMTVPYCMIHFGKPMRETFAAIVAGVLLGFMSLKTRSVWLGAALHIGVAITMDVAALTRRGHLNEWWDWLTG